MARTAIALALAVGAAFLPPAAHAQAGLVAAYGFNEGAGATTADASGNANTGTLANATWSATGKFGKALSFNGTNAWVTVADSASLHLTSGMTLEAWVNPSALGATWRCVVLKEQTAGLIYALYAQTDTNQPSGHVFIASEFDTRGTALLPVNAWTHLAATYDGATLRMYANGVLASSKLVGGAIKTSTGALRIGGDSIWGEYFSGLIDEVRIYNRALSATEIQIDMNTAVGGTPPPPDTTPPTVSVTAPAAGATVSGTVALAANAGDNVGVVGVQFSVNGTAVGAEVTAAPYTVNWDSTSVANGTPYNITARARDAAGNATTSTAVAVTVNNTVTPPPPPPPPPPPATGLVAAYGFNEGAGTTTADISGNSNTGTLANATWSATGKFGKALSFNGTNALVSIADSASLHLTSGMTLEAWVNPAALGTAWRCAILKEQTGGMLWALYGNTDTSQPSGHVFIASEFNTRGTAALPLNAWTHLATTYDGAALRLYVNGVLAGSLAVTGAIKTSTGALRIGGNTIWGEYFSGLIDEVRIYSRALSAAEIQTDMNTAVGGTPPPPDTTPPTVSVTAPPAGATVSGTVALAANAGDNVGVVGVQFSVNGTAVGAEVTAAPYTVNWDSTSVANGTPYNITARARDAAGNATTSTAVAVTVNNTVTPPPPPSTGLVAAYAFNEGAGTALTDVTGHGNTGVISGATWTATGKYGAALSFDGASNRVDIPDSVGLHLSSGMTLEAWVRPAAVTGWRCVLLKEQTGGMLWALYGNTDTNRPSGHVFVASEFNTRGTAQVALNAWTHLAATYDGSVLRLYVNGAQASSITVGGDILIATGSLRIGGNTIWGEYFSGLIDEVRIYNRALSATEIQTDMNTALPSTAPPPPTDPIPPTVSVTSPAAGATISGRATLYANASDNVGVAGVQFYLDGSPFGAEVTIPPYTATWETTSATNAAHTITAAARDAAGNRTVSAPAAVTVSNTNDPAVVGSWTAPFNWPIVAINMVVTRAGNVVSWDGPPSNGGSSALEWSPATGNFTAIPNNVTNMFCDAAVVLSDGRVLAFGGHADWGVGLTNADIYDPVTKLWTPVASMNYARWYPTATVLPDGRVLAVSGANTCETCISSIPEIYDPVANTWTAMPTADFPVTLYPHIFVLPDGRILEAGASRAPVPTRVLDLNTKVWTTVDPVSHDGHSAVMYDLNKIMKSGSSADVGVTTDPSESTTFTLDMTQASPAWQQTANMAYPRAFHNLTLLPDGTVLTVAGGATKDGEDYTQAVLPAEIWTPQTKSWRTMAPQSVGRLYHGTAVLLLDGRVLVAGSGRAGTDPRFSGEIFSPPYLFKGARPAISSAATDAGYGANFFVGTANTDIVSVNLLRISATTHAFNMEQRLLRLNFLATAGGFTVTAPANANIAPPGYYQLHLLNSAGVPSVGAVIHIH